jgi:HEAT repeat protein
VVFFSDRLDARPRGRDFVPARGLFQRKAWRPPVSPHWMFREESFELIRQMLAQEENLRALDSELAALGHLDNVAAVPLVVRYAKHSDRDIRYSVAFALGRYHDDPAAIAILRDLAEDSDRHVRDWAIFGLGVLGNADNEEIRQIFLAHLDDSFLDARIEAAAALAKRQDVRVARPLIQMLKKEGDLYGLLEAARDLLQMKHDLADWFLAEYIAALEKKFPA